MDWRLATMVELSKKRGGLTISEKDPKKVTGILLPLHFWGILSPLWIAKDLAMTHQK